ncbi:hypothetical protein [Thermococcus aciditolerans]|uniref:hypothetical protein n=1 Tax=Thermococcus aciditolerans TaxID=2598455 RepID=UPI00143D8CD0|nr:hypothetical protein [Thermococcus aciditolerans]
MYLSFVIDRIHYNPETGSSLPKGLPGAHSGEIDPAEVRERVGKSSKSSAFSGV